MGILNSKDFKKIDEATSNSRDGYKGSATLTDFRQKSAAAGPPRSFTSSLSNLRYVITEKPKWKVFKKKEVVALPAYRTTKGCPCGNDSPCKQKVTPKGVTIHYPQKKRKFAFPLKPHKIQKSYFSRLAWKCVSSALPFQTSFKANINISLPTVPIHKVTNAYKTVKSLGSRLPSIRSTIMTLKQKTKQPKAKRVSSADFMFMPFSAPSTVNKVKYIRQKKFPTWRLDQISCNSPFCKNYAHSCSRCSFAASKVKVKELVASELLPPSNLVGVPLERTIEPESLPLPSASSATVVNQESVEPLNM